MITLCQPLTQPTCFFLPVVLVDGARVLQELLALRPLWTKPSPLREEGGGPGAMMYKGLKVRRCCPTNQTTSMASLAGGRLAGVGVATASDCCCCCCLLSVCLCVWQVSGSFYSIDSWRRSASGPVGRSEDGTSRGSRGGRSGGSSPVAGLRGLLGRLQQK